MKNDYLGVAIIFVLSVMLVVGSISSIAKGARPSKCIATQQEQER